jgi:putative nucleotidyltransferase with HDIG domain
MKFLVADDDDDMREFLRATLESQGHTVDVATNGNEALEIARHSPPDMVISDILMPEVDGFMLCREIKDDETLHNIPFIFYSGSYLEPEHEKLALALGASAFINKPMEPAAFLDAIKRIISEHQAHKLTVPAAPIEDTAELARMHENVVVRKLGEKVKALEKEIAERKKAEMALQKNREQLRASLIGTVVAVSRAVGARDPYTAGHQQRVSQLSRAIAQEMGLDSEWVDGLRMGASIHDIGKIYLPAEILSKPTKLTDLEYELIKSHAQVGYDILKDIVFPCPVAEIAHQHHERLDGSGYPQGLKGEEICLEARIVAVADVVEAMVSHRPYRPSLGIDKALAEIKLGRGSSYDAEVADACLRLFAENKFSFD